MKTEQDQPASDTPRTDEIVSYLEVQFPATIGHIPLRERVEKLERELNAASKNARGDKAQAFEDLERIVAALETDNKSAGEGFELLAHNFPEIQLECDTPLAAAKLISERVESLQEALRIAERRLKWLHDCSTGQTDPEGYEWGIYRVKWENGVAVSVQCTNSDHSDLDAEMEREAKKP